MAICPFFFFLPQLLLSGLAIYAPALALNQGYLSDQYLKCSHFSAVTGWNLWVVIVVTGMVCTAYCALVWNNKSCKSHLSLCYTFPLNWTVSCFDCLDLNGLIISGWNEGSGLDRCFPGRLRHARLLLMLHSLHRRISNESISSARTFGFNSKSQLNLNSSCSSGVNVLI